MMSFSEWIESELTLRGWSRSEAARRGKISASMMDKVINGAAQPGLNFMEGISRAFQMPLAQVLERAGKDPYSMGGEHLSEREELFASYDQMTPEARERVKAIIRLELEQARRRSSLKVDTSPLKPKTSQP